MRKHLLLTLVLLATTPVYGQQAFDSCIYMSVDIGSNAFHISGIFTVRPSENTRLYAEYEYHHFDMSSASVLAGGSKILF